MPCNQTQIILNDPTFLVAFVKGKLQLTESIAEHVNICNHCSALFNKSVKVLEKNNTTVATAILEAKTNIEKRREHLWLTLTNYLKNRTVYSCPPGNDDMMYLIALSEFQG